MARVFFISFLTLLSFYKSKSESAPKITAPAPAKTNFSVSVLPETGNCAGFTGAADARGNGDDCTYTILGVTAGCV